MKFVRAGVCLVLGVGVAGAGAVARAQESGAKQGQAAVRAHDVSIEEHRQHLASLVALVDACAKARNAKGCDTAAVGQDDRVAVTLGGKKEPRLVRYDWLRAVLVQAAAPEETAGKRAQKPEPPAQNPKQMLGITDVKLPPSELLKAAKARLEEDLAKAGAPVAAAADHAKERAAMREVLASAEFRNLQDQTVKDSVLEKFARWLNHLFASASVLQARAAWIGRVIVWGFILGVSLALLVALLRLERRWRVRLAGEESERPAPGAASARDWQLWLEDARRAAAKGQWREAIHFVYWAAISRLESRRLWPADRARTPREYLELVAQEDPRKAGLSQLTRTFERFWYGGRAAEESDYRTAENVAAGLIGGAGNSAGGEGGGR